MDQQQSNRSIAEADGRYVEVAVQAPLRRTYTYRLPDRLIGKVAPGSRVAVPFGRRKLVGFVLDTNSRALEGRTMKELAGVLESEPILPQELLSFLADAATYYHHPIGEVLRAAAPALPTEALKLLRQQGFLERGETLPGERVSTRRVLMVRPSADSPPQSRVGSNQRKILTLLEERGEISLDELRQHLKNPRHAVRSLEKKRIVATFEREAPIDPFFSEKVSADIPPRLNPAQSRAVSAIINNAPGSRSAYLLYGVTGSGKTEVYLRVIAEFRARGLGALVLVPEIALTPQLVSRFRARFGDAIAVLHSGLSIRERNRAWHCLRRGAVDLAVGARSALFAPVRKLGVIIVDEEHDASFKQEEGFRYHARDMALWRAHSANAVCVLGSATPSMESFYRAQQGKLQLLTLPERATPQPLPAVEIVDLARHRQGPSQHRLLTEPMLQALESCRQTRGQAILFLNRRGFSPSVRCVSCGEVAQCPACNVALVEHRREGVLRCHYCDFSKPLNTMCSECGGAVFESLGVGTERLEEALATRFPELRVARLDRDIAAGQGVESVLERLRRGEIDILVGTQMVTKGHDIPGVVLVGVMLADQSLAFPDFRASERTFQLLSQVAGRAGRGEKKGRVLIQSYQPQHPAIESARTHDYLSFYHNELRARREVGFPPFSRVVAVRVDAGGETEARKAAAELARVARNQRAVREGRVRLLGPAPAPISRLRGRYRFRLMLRAADRAALRVVTSALVERIDRGIAPARVILDVDPISML
ncbi:MAG: primosomal protein N' [Deltaproteobacteria bacterium]|nr:primosomal protein N' [Deltaproteobacteria bacterium]